MPSKKQFPNWVLVSTYALPLERVHTSTIRDVLDLEDVLKVIHHWNPFNQEESPFMHMQDLYSAYYWVPVAARSEHYIIMFPAHMDKDAFQGMVDNGMFIRNHNFHRSIELVSTDY